MRTRILLIFLTSLLVISLLSSASSSENELNSDLKAVYDVMYSLETWGMAHDSELISSELLFIKNQKNNKYLYLVCKDLRNRLTWKNYRLFQSLETFDINEYQSWNRRYLEDLLIKYFYFSNKKDGIEQICNKRYFPREYYSVGPLKKNWNNLIRSQWTYLFDPDFEFSTPFGIKKYTKLKNAGCIDYITGSSTEYEYDEVDFNKSIFVYAFTAYFNTSSKMLIRTNISGDEIYVNSLKLDSYRCCKNSTEHRTFPVNFSKGRYDFVIQTQEPQTSIDIEFVPIEESEVNIEFNTKFTNDYGQLKHVDNVSTNSYACKNFYNFVLFNTVHFDSDSWLDKFFYAINANFDLEKYENWSMLEKIKKSNPTPVVNYFFAKASSESSILPSTSKLKNSQPVFAEISEKHPNFLLAKFGQYKAHFNQNEYTKALNTLNEILKLDPKNELAWINLIQFYNEKDWMAQKFSTIMKANKSFPDNVDFLLMRISQLINHNNASEAVDLFNELFMVKQIIPVVKETYFLWSEFLKIIDSYSYPFDIKNSMWEHCVKLYEDYSPNVLSDYSKFLRDNGKYNEAIEVLLNLFKKKPSFQTAKDISEIHFILDNYDQGILYLKKSIALNPKLKSADRQYLLNIQNNSDSEFYKNFGLSIEEMMKTKINPKDYPDSSSVVFLDEEIRRVFPDGSTTSIITSVRYILTSEGAEEFGTVTTDGDIIKAQVIKSNGEIIEPSVIGKSINFQGIEIGSIQIIVTQEILEDFGVDFYFSDPDHKEYYLTSRFVILMHKDIENFQINEKFIKVKNSYDFQDYHVFEYEKLNSSPIPEPKEYDPGISTYLPHVDLRKKIIDPQDTHFFILESEYQYPLTSIIKQKALELTEKYQTIFEKAENIYNFVSQEIESDFFVDNPTETLLKKTGNKTNLLLALYRASNIEYEIIKILTPEAYHNLQLSNDFSILYFADFINGLRIKLDTKWHYLILDDQTMKYTAFNTFPFNGAIGFNFNNYADFFIIDTTNNSSNLIETSDFTIHIKDNEAKSTGYIDFSILKSNSLRTILEENPDTFSNQFIREMIIKNNRNLTIDKLSIRNKFSSSKLSIGIEGKFKNSLHKTDNDQLEISLCLNPLNLIKKYTPTASRDLKLKIDDGDFEYKVDTRIIEIPKGYIVQNLPTSTFLFAKNFIYLLTIKHEGSQILITRKWKTVPAEYEVSEYDHLKQYCQFIDNLEKSIITFHKIN